MKQPCTHGTLPCRLCFLGGRGGWHLYNNPGAWSAREPRVVALGFAYRRGALTFVHPTHAPAGDGQFKRWLTGEPESVAGRQRRLERKAIPADCALTRSTPGQSRKLAGAAMTPLHGHSGGHCKT
jgi:hypothetical protein